MLLGYLPNTSITFLGFHLFWALATGCGFKKWAQCIRLGKYEDEGLGQANDVFGIVRLSLCGPILMCRIDSTIRGIRQGPKVGRTPRRRPASVMRFLCSVVQ